MIYIFHNFDVAVCFTPIYTWLFIAVNEYVLLGFLTCFYLWIIALDS